MRRAFPTAPDFANKLPNLFFKLYPAVPDSQGQIQYLGEVIFLGE